MISGYFHIPRAEALNIVGGVISHFEKAHLGMNIKLVLYKQGIFDLAKSILQPSSER